MRKYLLIICFCFSMSASAQVFQSRDTLTTTVMTIVLDYFTASEVYAQVRIFTTLNPINFR